MIKIITSKNAYHWKVVLVLVFVSFFGFSQTANDTGRECDIKSLPDLFKKKDSVLTLKSQLNKDSFFLIIPVIGSSPATGFLYGGVAQYTFKGKKAENKYSSFNIGATYTTNKQLLVVPIRQ